MKKEQGSLPTRDEILEYLNGGQKSRSDIFEHFGLSEGQNSDKGVKSLKHNLKVMSRHTLDLEQTLESDGELYYRQTTDEAERHLLSDKQLHIHFREEDPDLSVLSDKEVRKLADTQLDKSPRKQPTKKYWHL